MTIQQMLLGAAGGTGAVVALADYALDVAAWTDASFGSFAGASAQINSNGWAQNAYADDWTSYAYGNVELWLEAGNAGDVEVYCSYTGSAPAGSAVNTWLLCSTTRTWNLEQSGVGSKSCTLTFTFRDRVSLATLDTALVNLQAEVSY